MFIATLYPSRAFDRVEYCKLFDLININMCPIYIHFLLHMYTNKNRELIGMVNAVHMLMSQMGVKQGCILPPLLFYIYIDVLLKLLESSNIGCSIGNTYLGCVAYADEVSLLAQSCQALRRMLSMCECFCLKYQVKFNYTKSHVTVCSKYQNVIVHNNFVLNGEEIDMCNSVQHLCHTISDNESKQKLIDQAISDMYCELIMLYLNLVLAVVMKTNSVSFLLCFLLWFAIVEYVSQVY